MSLKTLKTINQFDFGTTKIQCKYYFNGARAFIVAYWISMHLRHLFKVPRFKQIQWSNKQQIEWNDPFIQYQQQQQNYPHHVRVVSIVKWCSRNSKALRFLLNLFEVQKMFIVFEYPSVFIVKINFKYFWLSIKCPLIVVDDEVAKFYCHQSYTNCCCCCCSYCDNESELFCGKKVFWIKLNYMTDKCWGMVNYTMRGILKLFFENILATKIR